MNLEDAEEWLRRRHPDWPETGIAGSLENLQVGQGGPGTPAAAGPSFSRSSNNCGTTVRAAAFRGSRPHALRRGLRSRPDSAARAEKIEQDAGAIPRSRVVLLQGDHDLHAQHPVEVADLIDATEDPGSSDDGTPTRDHGFGRTAPTMVKTHRVVLERFDAPVPAVLLDTPYRFQENAADISGGSSSTSGRVSVRRSRWPRSPRKVSRGHGERHRDHTARQLRLLRPG